MPESFKNQMELAQYLAQNLYKMCEELDYIVKAIEAQIELLQSFKELGDNYYSLHESFKKISVDLVAEVISNHVNYLAKQQESLGWAISIQRGSGINFLKQEIERILERGNSLSQDSESARS